HRRWIEGMMNDTGSTMFNNHIRAALCIAVKSQVGLLEQLQEKALLRPSATGFDRVAERQKDPAFAAALAQYSGLPKVAWTRVRIDGSSRRWKYVAEVGGVQAEVFKEPSTRHWIVSVGGVTPVHTDDSLESAKIAAAY